MEPLSSLPTSKYPLQSPSFIVTSPPARVPSFLSRYIPASASFASPQSSAGFSIFVCGADSASAAPLLLVFALGTKSLSLPPLKSRAFQLSDFHSEALARRALKWVLLEDFEERSRGRPSLFEREHKIVAVAAKMPCGDCALTQSRDTGAYPYAMYREEQAGGAARLGDGERAGKRKWSLRIKPVRKDCPAALVGDNLSCSDKIMMWQTLGVQGKHLHAVIGKIYIDKYILPWDNKEEFEKVQKDISISLSFKKRLENYPEYMERFKSMKLSDEDNQLLLEKVPEIELYKPEPGEEDEKPPDEAVIYYYSPKKKQYILVKVNQKTGLKPGANLKQAFNRNASTGISRADFEQAFEKLIDSCQSDLSEVKSYYYSNKSPEPDAVGEHHGSSPDYISAKEIIKFSLDYKQ